jgi:hypothetical protein
MPEEHQNDETEVDEETDLPNLREAANRSKQNKAAAEAAQRELAFVKAGVDTDSKIGRLLLQSYDGDLTKDAITEFCKDIPGALPVASEQTTESAEGTTEGTQEATTDTSTRERTALAGDATAPEFTDPDPREEARKAIDTVVEQGGTRDDALAAGFATLTAAAVKGDQRVLG